MASAMAARLASPWLGYDMTRGAVLVNASPAEEFGLKEVLVDGNAVTGWKLRFLFSPPSTDHDVVMDVDGDRLTRLFDDTCDPAERDRLCRAVCDDIVEAVTTRGDRLELHSSWSS